MDTHLYVNVGRVFIEASKDMNWKSAKSLQKAQEAALEGIQWTIFLQKDSLSPFLKIRDIKNIFKTLHIGYGGML